MLLLLWLATSPADTATSALSLAEAVSLAIASRPEVRAARSQHGRAELASFRAQLDRVRLTADAQVQELYAKSNIGGEGFAGGLGLSNVSASLNVPLFSGFRVESNVDRAEELEQAALQDVAVAERATALSVARAYWSVRKIDLEREVQLRAVERMRSAESIAASRFAAGLAPPIDESRVRARRLVREATIADVEGASREAIAQLAVLLGVSGGVVLSDAPRGAGSGLPAMDQLLTRARDSRPELRAARARLRAQVEAIDIAKSGYWPMLSAYGLFQYGNNPSQAGAGSRAVPASANPFEGMAADVQAGVVLSVNLFDTLSTHTAVEDARYEEARLAATEAQAARAIEAEVRTAHARVGRLLALGQKLALAEGVARENLEINRRRYENGEAQVFELLESEVELLELEQRLAGLDAELTLAWIELDASAGSVVGGSDR